MKKIKSVSGMIFLAVLSLALIIPTGCSNKENDVPSDIGEDFKYSKGLDENGFWEGITALDHVDLCDYEGIPVPSEAHTISEGDVLAHIDTILADYTNEKQITDRAVEDGDTVNIDYIGRIDGEEFSGGNTGGNGAKVTIGVTQYVDDFLEQLIGHTPGETFDVEVTFPDDYHQEDLQGKDAVFETTVNHIVESETPELTDEFVSEYLAPYYGYETMGEMKSQIHDSMKASAIELYIQEYLMENSTVEDVPENLIIYQENTLVLYYMDYAAYYEMEFEEFMPTYLGVSTTKELLEKFRTDNEKTAEFYLLLQAVAEDTGIRVSDEDLPGYFEEHTGSADFTEYEQLYGMPHLKLVALHQAVMDHITESAVLE
jgi:trigger factor